MRFAFKVHSVGPDVVTEVMTREGGEKVKVDVNCLALELVSESESVGSLSLWLTREQVDELFKSFKEYTPTKRMPLAPGDTVVVDILPGEKKANEPAASEGVSSNE